MTGRIPYAPGGRTRLGLLVRASAPDGGGDQKTKLVRGCRRAQIDPECMDRRCVAREIGEDGVIWSCLNVSGLWVERMWLLAIMEVSAQTILLGDKPRWGCRGHQFSHAPGRPLLHFFLSLSQTSVGNGCATCSLISYMGFRESSPGLRVGAYFLPSSQFLCSA